MRLAYVDKGVPPEGYGVALEDRPTTDIKRLDKGELEALRWEDRVGDDFYIRRKGWSGEQKEPKTEKRNSHSDHSSPLRASRRRVETGRSSANGMDKLHWHGWHAFRRGLATNLRELGVADDVVQRILRHAHVSTTQEHYAKTLAPSVRKAMAKFDRSSTADKRRTAKKHVSQADENGGPGRSRTADQRFRKPLLYPSELRGQSGVTSLSHAS